MEPEGDRNTACVIAQQYSSATFIHCVSIPSGRYSVRCKNVKQGIHKRMVLFEKLTRNLFLTLHGHNVHRQQQQQQ